MIDTLLIKVIGYILAASLVCTGVYTGYAYVKQIGYDEAAEKYDKIIHDYKDLVGEKISNLETMSNKLAEDTRVNNETLSKDIAKITRTGKPLVIYKDGNCIPSQNFSDSISAINARANQNVKGTSK
jgi:hypothetical protein